MVVREAEAALKEREASISELKQQADAAWAQLEEVRGCIEGKYPRVRLSRFLIGRDLSSFFAQS